jgi:hypothetical protein
VDDVGASRVGEGNTVSAKKTCKDPSCERPALDQAVYCGEHVGERRRCKKTRVIEGRTQRCKKPALIGLDVCEKHGGRFPQSQALSQRSKALTVMQRFVRPFEGDLNPISAFEMEFRRTLGRIAWYDEALAALGDEKDLIWGLTKHERGTNAEGLISVKTYEARVNILEEMQRWERKHLVDLEKVWIGAGLEQRRLDLLSTYVGQVQKMVERAFEHMGLDMSDPRVKEAILAVNPDDPMHLPHIDVDAIEVGS